MFPQGLLAPRWLVWEEEKERPMADLTVLWSTRLGFIM